MNEQRRTAPGPEIRPVNYAEKLEATYETVLPPGPPNTITRTPYPFLGVTKEEAEEIHRYGVLAGTGFIVGVMFGALFITLIFLLTL